MHGVLENRERRIQETSLHILVTCNQFYVLVLSYCYPQCSQTDDAILRSLPSSITELSFLLSSQLLVSYEEERKLFLADGAEERIELARELCRVHLFAETDG